MDLGNYQLMICVPPCVPSEQPQSRAPQCILLGFAKCGTSALLEFLDLHPRMVTLDWEPDYFCDRMYKKYDLKW